MNLTSFLFSWVFIESPPRGLEPCVSLIRSTNIMHLFCHKSNFKCLGFINEQNRVRSLTLRSLDFSRRDRQQQK